MEDEDLEDEDFEAEYDAIVQSALLILAEGPMTLGDLVVNLRRVGVLDVLGDSDNETLMVEVDELLLDTDEVWMSEDRFVGLVALMLDGAVFTHRLSESELERGVLDATPDIGAIDFDQADGLYLDTGGTLECHYPFEGESELDEHGSFVTLPGTLAPFSPGDLVYLKRTGSSVSLEKAPDLGGGEAELAALRAAFENQHVVGYGVEPESLVMDALCHDPTLFRSPVAPIGELLEQIGLEGRGAWYGLGGEAWAPPAVRYAERALSDLHESWGFDDCCTIEFELVHGSFMLFSNGYADPTKEELRLVAKGLAHGSVAPAFAEFVLSHGRGSDNLTSFAMLLTHASGKLAAPAFYLLGLEAEQDGDALTAEAHLRSSVLADPEYVPALAELAWYEADRGEGARAISFLLRSGAREDNLELDYISSQFPVVDRHAGRNDPCPCGSGRKFKACCMNGPTLTIEQRAGWLHHKAGIFLLRPARRDRIQDLAQLVNYGLSSSTLVELLPFLVDVAIFEGGGLEEFISDRGVLLPPDELALAQTWLGTPLGMFEVTEVQRGTGITLRDTRSGERQLVTDVASSETLSRGDYLLARVVIAGTQRQFMGLPLHLSLRHRERVIELLDSEPDPIDIAMWMAMTFAPPRMTNREAEDLMFGRAVLRPRSGSWEVLAEQLDSRFGPENNGQWTETIDFEGENLIRSHLHREGDDLVVETNSNERLDRTMAVLLDELNVDFDIMDEQRLDPDEAIAQHRDSSDLSGVINRDDMPEELAAALADIMRAKETAWLDEEIPALAGLTPRQAADNPTRREDLIALLNEFDRHDNLATGMQSFDAARLRRELGL